MDDRPKANVTPPLFYADYGVDWDRPGSDRTVWMTATEVEARRMTLFERLIEARAELDRRQTERCAEMAEYILSARYVPIDEPESTEPETALHRAVLATRKEN